MRLEHRCGRLPVAGGTARPLKGALQLVFLRGRWGLDHLESLAAGEGVHHSTRGIGGPPAELSFELRAVHHRAERDHVSEVRLEVDMSQRSQGEAPDPAPVRWEYGCWGSGHDRNRLAQQD